MVLVGRPPRGTKASYVDVDNRGGAPAAVAHLARCRSAGRWRRSPGRRTWRPASTGLPAIATRSTERRALRGRELEAAATSPRTAGGRDERLLAAAPTSTRSSPRRTSWPLGALAVLRAAGRRVPDDVAVVGFDDSPVARHARPHLTSVRQPIEEMGRELARLLIDDRSPDAVPRRVILGDPSSYERARAPGGAAPDRPATGAPLRRDPAIPARG